MCMRTNLFPCAGVLPAHHIGISGCCTWWLTHFALSKNLSSWFTATPFALMVASSPPFTLCLGSSPSSGALIVRSLRQSRSTSNQSCGLKSLKFRQVHLFGHPKRSEDFSSSSDNAWKSLICIGCLLIHKLSGNFQVWTS